jgi:hypothetical protein
LARTLARFAKRIQVRLATSKRRGRIAHGRDASGGVDEKRN